MPALVQHCCIAHTSLKPPMRRDVLGRDEVPKTLANPGLPQSSGPHCEHVASGSQPLVQANMKRKAYLVDTTQHSLPPVS